MGNEARSSEPVVIRKYANRRLYNTATAEFVTLADLHEMVKREEEFVVREAKTDRDITCSVLAQIIAEEEAKGYNLLPLGYLRRVLSFYHQGVGEQLSSYLESSMEAFVAHQRELLRQMQGAVDPATALQELAQLGKRNVELFQRSMEMFIPKAPPSPAPPPDETPSAGAASSADELKALRDELRDLQRRLDQLEKS